MCANTVAYMRTTLKAERYKRRLTLRDIAQASGVHLSTISRLERGDTQPMLETANAIEDALGLKRGSLVFGHREALAS